MSDNPTSPTAFRVERLANPHSAPASSHSMDLSTMSAVNPSREQPFKKPLDISNLMSPPEPPRFDSFSHNQNNSKPMGKVSSVRRTGPIPPLSPPISPATKTDDQPVSVVSMPNIPVKDPILYPGRDTTGSPQQQPLFVQDDPVDTRRIVDEHTVSRPADLFRKATPPRPEDYALILYFSSRVMEMYRADPQSYLERERAFLLADRQAGLRNGRPKLQPILPAKPTQVRKETQRAKNAKPCKVTKATQSHTTAARPIRSYPPTGHGQQATHRLPSATPDPSPRRAVAPNREDKDFNSVEDFCPPKEALPDRPNSLKVDWKGTPIDLTNDPHREKLHPEELSLAANLRLDCATYLTSKKRIFVRRLECLRMGKEFRKTDAQQACKIDVNKASKLWMAFDKVGWLDKAWMAPYL
ncbi:hypothetical protein GGS23DRAFT_206580 [Durotheca rogersii]|uniref:uncharacterized protein n=1 Tax=Durotheca rogersii TaxID=419775 RepID=UPI00221EA41D|nr:uncharacterized protein GGS23DRAFT_206580 [Durotheca rogersii]KAI5861049.1 hypothetical protein GGS23DRAFT_206580 [Durotheca rogersii]